MQIHKNSLEIIKNYDAFIVDVWGVIHSSGILYKNTENAMKQMMECGRVILLSNAPRRAKKVADFLTGIGIKQNIHYHNILTSGEAFLCHAKKSEYKTVFYMGPEKDLDIFDNDLNDNFSQDLQGTIEITRNIEDSFDDAIVTGLTDVEDISKDIPNLENLLQKGTVLSCINPDIVVKVGNDHQFCAGAVAKEYEKMGGSVKYFGKPHGDVYNMAFEMLNGIKKNKILAIGDGMETDILGANNVEIDSLLCVGGIHEKEIYWKGVDEFLKEYKQRPVFVAEGV
jgi:HAD superfamily hydrolase (TIGR01459 family)